MSSEIPKTKTPGKNSTCQLRQIKQIEIKQFIKQKASWCNVITNIQQQKLG